MSEDINCESKINVMKLIFSSILIVLSLPLLSQWDNSNSTDEMTGEVSAYCSSPLTSPTKSMDFPYSDTKAWLGIGCDGVSEWVYVGFTNAPNLLDTDTQDGYNVFTTRIKWDDELISERFIQNWGAKFIHFTDIEGAIENIIQSNTLLVELNWHGSGKTYFRFNLSGSSKAIAKLRAQAGYTPEYSINSNAELEEDALFMIVENMPALGPCTSMIGDERYDCTRLEILKYFSTNVKYPPIEKDAGIQGTVYVYFVIGRKGAVRDVKILQGVNLRIDEEAQRLVESLPKFEPGQQRGVNVSVPYTIPVKFVIR
jgi:TonB family protein